MNARSKNLRWNASELPEKIFSNMPAKTSLESILLLMLVAVNVTSVFGYAFFTLNPHMIARFPWSAPIFAVSYPLFARLQIALAFAGFAVACWRASGLRWLPAFFAVMGISLSAELGGTSVGIPFGKYSYTALLGPKIFDLVPFLIPLSWFFMAVPSYDLAWRVYGEDRSRWARLSLASIILLFWDLTLDPAMSHLTPFWIWSKEGFYYGAPLTNKIGWFLTGVAIMGALEALNARNWIRNMPRAFGPTFYLVNISLPFLMVVFAGLWGALAVSLTLIGIYAFLYRSSQTRVAVTGRATEPSRVAGEAV